MQCIIYQISYHINFVPMLRDLGVTLDSSLSFNQHVMNTCRSAFLELRHISLTHKYFTVDATKTIVCSLVLSRLDYCNSILSGSPKCLIQKLQGVQNTAAWITLRMPRTEHTTPLLRMLHWLPIPSRIAYKIDSMPHCVDYCISKISARAVECVYTSKTTALIIGSKYPQDYRSKNKVIWTESFFLPGTHQLEQGPWQH